MTADRRPPFRSAIFDLDGTLLDTLQDLADSMNSALLKNGLPSHPAKSYRLFVGDGIDQLALKASGRPDLTATLVSDMRLHYSENWRRLTRPYDGIPDVLSELAALRVPLSVLSNKPDAFTKIMTRHFFPGIPFRIVAGARDGIPNKPDPSGALGIARETAVSPEDTVFFGDSGIDMRAAKNAGMTGAGVLWGFRTREELLTDGARLLIDEPKDMLKLFRPAA